jgi:hypothetical protein
MILMLRKVRVVSISFLMICSFCTAICVECAFQQGNVRPNYSLKHRGCYSKHCVLNVRFKAREITPKAHCPLFAS